MQYYTYCVKCNVCNPHIASFFTWLLDSSSASRPVSTWIIERTQTSCFYLYNPTTRAKTHVSLMDASNNHLREPLQLTSSYVTQSMRWLISCYSTCSAVAAVIQRLTSCWRGGEAASRKNTVKKKNTTNKKNLHHCQLCAQSAVDTGCAASSHTLGHGHSCVVNLPQSASDRYQLCSELWL